MSRSEYEDCDDASSVWLYREAVRRAVDGRRGQAFLLELRSALETMPVKRLAAGIVLDTHTGDCCAMGAVFAARELDVALLDGDGSEEYAADTARVLGIAPSLAREIAYENDDLDGYRKRTPEERHAHMLAWTRQHLHSTDASAERVTCGCCSPSIATSTPRRKMYRPRFRRRSASCRTR